MGENVGKFFFKSCIGSKTRLLRDEDKQISVMTSAESGSLSTLTLSYSVISPSFVFTRKRFKEHIIHRWNC